MTEEMKQEAQREFAAMLNGVKMAEGKLDYSIKFKHDDRKAIVWLSTEAYTKILALVMEFADEVAWHGTAVRLEQKCEIQPDELQPSEIASGKTMSINSNENIPATSNESITDISTEPMPAEFLIEDIFVYPQEVTGSTVNTDQTAYIEWLYGLDDETFSKLRMQGHSHVKMGVSPSGVDDAHRKQILEQLEQDMFYIFMIWNKSLMVHTLIYDMANNTLYEDKDVEVKLLGNEGLVEFMADAKDKVCKSFGRNTGNANDIGTGKNGNTFVSKSSSSKNGGANKKSKRGQKNQMWADGDDEYDYFHGYNQYGYGCDEFEYPPLFEVFDPFDVSRKSW